MSGPKFTRIVLVAWSIAILVISVRLAIAPGSHSVYPIYTSAGKAWVNSQSLYGTLKAPTGFFYSPPTVAFFALFSSLPAFAGEVLWRLLFVAVCFAGINWWLKTSARRFITPESHALFYLLLLPLLLPSFNNGQANCLVLGLLVWAIAAAGNASWNLAAFCVAAATCFKIYPLVMGLLLALIYPRRFSWRFIVTLACMGALPLVLQHPGYAMEQYRAWLTICVGNGNRHIWAPWIAPHDLWLLLKSLNIPIDDRGYQVVQALSGAAIAAICLWSRIRRPQDVLLFTLFSMSCLWMVLCGPATESSTYVLIAPTLAISVLHAIQSKSALWLRVWIVVVLALTFSAFGVNSLSAVREAGWMSLQPFTALLLFGYVVLRTLSLKFGFFAGAASEIKTAGEVATSMAARP